MKKLATRFVLTISIALLLAPAAQAQSQATLNITPVLVDFGTVSEGGRARQNLTLTNLTAAPLDVTGFTKTGSASFSVDLLGGGKPCGSVTPSLTAHDDCTLEAIFMPEFAEEASGTLTFTPNDDSTKAITVRLKGKTPDDGGCSLGAGSGPGAWWGLGILLGLALSLRRRFRA